MIWTENIAKEIAINYNGIKKLGEHLNEISLGVVTAIQKPVKLKWPIENLKPTSLLPMLNMICKILPELDASFPSSKADCRQGESTKEYVLLTKILAEKTAASQSFTLHLPSVDIPKAFGRGQGATLLKNLQSIQIQMSFTF